MKIVEALLFFSLFILLSSCGAHKPYLGPKSVLPEDAEVYKLVEADIVHELYFVGGLHMEEGEEDNALIKWLKTQTKKSQAATSIVFLGDLFDKTGPQAKEYQANTDHPKKLRMLFNELDSLSDHLFLIPGDHEWSDGRHQSINGLQAFKEFIRTMGNEQLVIAPENACGEIKVVELNKDLVLFLMDSQWLLQDVDFRDRINYGCEIDDDLGFMNHLNATLREHSDKQVIIAAHHPVYSNGTTAGNYPASRHFIPAPIIGTIASGLKRLLGSSQEFGHPRYEIYRSLIKTALARYHNVVFVSGHENNLQYIPKEDHHFIISGSSIQTDFVGKSKDAGFAFMNTGATRLVHTTDGSLWLQFYARSDDTDSKFHLVYQQNLVRKTSTLPINTISTERIEEFTARTHPASPSKIYGIKMFGLGEMYRKEWSLEVAFPALFLNEVEGGLTPIKTGGGMQTKSLRLRDSLGQQYVLRSMDKDVTKSVPPPLRRTFAHNLIQGGMAASHPYGALVIPHLSAPAGIFHTNPRIVWLPKQKLLEQFESEYADQLYLFEERPGGNTERRQSFGYPTKTINTFELIEKVKINHKHKVDQQTFLKARIFDMLIGDGDRHEDNWRWGVFRDNKDDEIRIYKAIPRDRDQVFLKNNGFLHYIVSRSWFNPKFQKFDPEIKDMAGFHFGARHIDRSFLTEMTRDDFQKAAIDIKEALTDKIIDEAFKAWPEEIFNLNGHEIVATLKQRRDRLLDFADAYYEYLSKEIIVHGTDGPNVFQISFLSGNRIDAKIFHLTSSKKRHLYWHRVLNGAETNELQLYGLKGDDQFELLGESSSTIKIRLIGGAGNDTVENNGASNKIWVYDRPDGITMTGAPVKSGLSEAPGVNTYDRTDWEMDRHFQFPMLTFATDEGLGLSYNIWLKKFGFRSDPYQSLHRISLALYSANKAIIGNYTGHWPNAIGQHWDFHFSAEGRGPAFSQFFYGLGNEYVNYEKIFPEINSASGPGFHIVRGSRVSIRPGISRDLGVGRSLRISLNAQYLNLENPGSEVNRFIFTERAFRTPEDFEAKFYLGLGLEYEVARLNIPSLPTRGFKFTIGTDYRYSLTNNSFSNVTIRSGLKAYIPFDPAHTLVLALNIGTAYTFGNYEFFHANYLSSSSELRGFKTRRFAGDGIVYHATDLRLRLIDGRLPFNTSMGLFTAFDYGRSFLKGDTFDKSHISYGGGIFLTWFDILSFKAGYHIGEEDRQLRLGSSMLF